jgi:hypothetical protein
MVGSPFQLSIHLFSGPHIYPSFITNRKFKDCNYYYNQCNSLYTEFTSYSNRVFSFSVLSWPRIPLCYWKLKVPLTKLHSRFASVSTSLILTWCNYHHFITATFLPRLLLILHCTSFLRLVGIWNKFRCSLHAHKLYDTRTELERTAWP